ncbi:hypothetical protein [Desertivirga brevis]|uniref:hypothetical protein n=1 Tax=Desertivirga brevis TaxID=2810310 RepID=UPI001A95E259|nr:hypothetical protein [Pedobacter sp. SYSU D00873]
MEVLQEIAESVGIGRLVYFEIILSAGMAAIKKYNAVEKKLMVDVSNTKSALAEIWATLIVLLNKNTQT